MNTSGRRWRSRGMVSRLFTLALLAVATLWGGAVYKASQTLEEFFAENRRLKEAITHLTAEEQIGYAKVVAQEYRDGRLYTQLRFVETARGDQHRKVLEKEYTIEGDIVHFDAMIVTFDRKMVMDGEKRALYLWRRVYGETMSPSDGYPIEQPGSAPERYADIFGPQPWVDRLLLQEDHGERFWRSVWDLANDPDRLRDYGVRAVYGNVVYSKLRPGLIYVFKINSSGHLYPETLPEM